MRNSFTKYCRVFLNTLYTLITISVPNELGSLGKLADLAKFKISLSHSSSCLA